MANPGGERPGHPGLAMEVRHSLNSPKHTQSLKVVLVRQLCVVKSEAGSAGITVAGMIVA